jgi:hypothetical protein
MPNDEHDDNPGILLPPPLTYGLTLLAGLVLDRKPHVPLLPRGPARTLGWPLLVGGVTNHRTMRACARSQAP